VPIIVKIRQFQIGHILAGSSDIPAIWNTARCRVPEGAVTIVPKDMDGAAMPTRPQKGQHHARSQRRKNRLGYFPLNHQFQCTVRIVLVR
jgi:hypothetical protein